MKNSRFFYLVIILGIIALGILSRKITFIPLFIGDLLYAAMVYFAIRFIMIQASKTKVVLIAIVFCSGIELLQLCNWNWMVSLRNTLFGRYVLGQGFLWGDLVAYSFGVLISYYVESLIKNTGNRL